MTSYADVNFDSYTTAEKRRAVELVVTPRNADNRASNSVFRLILKAVDLAEVSDVLHNFKYSLNTDMADKSLEEIQHILFHAAEHAVDIRQAQIDLGPNFAGIPS